MPKRLMVSHGPETWNLMSLMYHLQAEGYLCDELTTIQSIRITEFKKGSSCIDVDSLRDIEGLIRVLQFPNEHVCSAFLQRIYAMLSDPVRLLLNQDPHTECTHEGLIRNLRRLAHRRDLYDSRALKECVLSRSTNALLIKGLSNLTFAELVRFNHLLFHDILPDYFVSKVKRSPISSGLNATMAETTDGWRLTLWTGTSFVINREGEITDLIDYLSAYAPIEPISIPAALVERFSLSDCKGAEC